MVTKNLNISCRVTSDIKVLYKVKKKLVSRFRLLRLYRELWYKLCVNQIFYRFIWELINYGHEHCLHNKKL